MVEKSIWVIQATNGKFYNKAGFWNTDLYNFSISTMVFSSEIEANTRRAKIRNPLRWETRVVEIINGGN